MKTKAHETKNMKTNENTNKGLVRMAIEDWVSCRLDPMDGYVRMCKSHFAIEELSSWLNCGCNINWFTEHFTQY